MPTRCFASFSQAQSRNARKSQRHLVLAQTRRLTLRILAPRRGQPKKQSHAGAIAGGVVGGLVVLLALLAGGLWYVRRARRRVRMEEAAARDAAIAASARCAIPIRSESVKDDDDDTPMTEGPAGVVRAGTFNLGAVRFTEDSLDHLRAIDRPPAYDVPPPCTPPLASGETPAATTAAAGHSTSPLGRVGSAASSSARRDEIDELPR